MASSIKLTNANGKILTITNPDSLTGDSHMNPTTTAYTIETVDDFGSVPSGYTTVIVKDSNRGGTFTWSATGTANGGTVFAGATGFWTRQYSGAVNVKWFGNANRSSLVSALNVVNGTGKTLSFDGISTATVDSTIALDNYNNFTVDLCKSVITYSGTGYMFDTKQLKNVTIKNGKFTGNVSNNFIRIIGNDYSQTVVYPSIPNQSNWSDQIIFDNIQIEGFSIQFELMSFCREIWFKDCYLTGFTKCIDIYGKAVNISVSNSILYSSISGSIALASIGDSFDVAYRYSEGIQLSDCIVDTQGSPFDLKDILLFKVSGGQIKGVNPVNISKGITPITKELYFYGSMAETKFNIGSSLLSGYNFDIKIKCSFVNVSGTAISIGAYSQSIFIESNFTQGLSTPIAVAIGANCTEINVSGNIDSTYITKITVDPTSYNGLKASFSGTFTPTIEFGGNSIGVTYSRAYGTYSWNGGVITGLFDITLTSKGTSTGSAKIGGLPFPAQYYDGSATVSSFSALNTAFYPILSVITGENKISIKNGGAGSQAVFTDVNLSNTTLLRGSFYMVMSL